MRQTHAGGDKLFVDYAGDTVPVVTDPLNGKTRPPQIFVAGITDGYRYSRLCELYRGWAPRLRSLFRGDVARVGGNRTAPLLARLGSALGF